MTAGTLPLEARLCQPIEALGGFFVRTVADAREHHEARVRQVLAWAQGGAES